MSVWVAPATWTNGAVTAAQMNAVRDNLTFLKGFADLITSGTTADTGTSTYLHITRASAATAISTMLSGDTNGRFSAYADGTLYWSDGTATGDVTLYRSAANVLKTDDELYVESDNGIRSEATVGTAVGYGGIVTGDSYVRGGILAGGSLIFGSGSDVFDCEITRGGPNTFFTPDGIRATGGIGTLAKAGVPADGDFVSDMQQDGVLAVDTTNSRLYVRVGSTWKYAALT